MDVDTFWKIVDGCKRSEEPEDALARRLRRLDAAEVASFDARFRRTVEQAFRWDLWGAAYLIEGGCSEDGFIYFLQGVIAKGRAVYERALENPDSLAAVEVYENEEFGQVAATVYEEVAGKPLRPVRWKRQTPAGKRWDFDDEAATARHLPKLQRRAVREAREAARSDAERANDTAPSRDTNPVQLLSQQDFVLQLSEGRRWSERKNWAKAVATYRKLLADLGDVVDPRIPYVHGCVMQDECERGAIARARVHYEAAVRTRAHLLLEHFREENATSRSWLDNELACFIWEHGADDELVVGLEHARNARADTDDLPAVRDTEMRILLRLGREKEARAIARKILEKDPKQVYFQDVKKRWGL